MENMKVVITTECGHKIEKTVSDSIDKREYKIALEGATISSMLDRYAEGCVFYKVKSVEYN